MTSRRAPAPRVPAATARGSAAGVTSGAQAFDRNAALWGTLVVVAALLVCVRSLGHGFTTWDDNINVTDNPLVRAPGFAQLGAIWSEPYANLYVPVSYTFWRALAFAGPGGPATLDPTLFHAANVVLHAFVAWLVWRLLARLGGDVRAAACGALLFALHPLQVESVAWISEARGLLAAAFGLAALELHLGASDHAGGERVLRRAVAFVLYVLGLLAKPSLVALPVVAFVIEVLWLARPWRRALAACACALVPASFAVWSASTAQAEKLGVVPDFGGRLVVAADTLGFYLTKLAWPFALGPDYGRTPDRVLGELGPRLAFVALGVIVVVLVVARASRAPRRTLACLALFVLPLAPVLGLVPFGYQKISTVADRYAYLALLGPALAAAWLGSRAFTRSETRARVFTFAAFTLAAAWSVIAWRQSAVWRDSRTLFEHALTVNERSYKAWNHVGLALAGENELDEAVQAFERSVALNPDHQIARYNLGSLLLSRGDAARALPHLEAAAALKPLDVSAQRHVGLALLALGRRDEGEARLRRAIELAPDDARSHGALGNSYVQRGAYAEAAREFELTLRTSDTPDVRYSLGCAYAALGRGADSVPQFRAALAQRRGWPEAEIELAVQIGLGPDVSRRLPDEAFALAQHAVIATNEQNARGLQVLAALHAFAGRAGEAVTAQEKALALVRAQSPAGIGVVQQRLDEYRRAAAEQK